LIVVDDGSTDDTAAVVESFDDERIRYVHLTENVGSSQARNHGLELAGGELIAFQDSDDLWRPQKLAVEVATLAACGDHIGVCVCSYRHVIDKKKRFVIHDPGEVDGEGVIRRHLMGEAFSTQTLVMRKAAMESAGGFDISLPCRQDWELCLRLAAKWSFVFVSDVLVDKEQSVDSISSDPWKFIDATAKVRARHPHLFEKYRSGYSIQLYNAGKYLALSGNHKAGLDYATRALGGDPLNWRAYVLIPTILTRTTSLLRSLKG
jgi:glycosyltransferase involved in cell wall biosynthesis